jgi:hypothetical protein
VGEHAARIELADRERLLSGDRACSAIVSWIVTPVSTSPARMARSTGAAPRQRGSSDGWTLRKSERSRRRGGM